MIANILYCADFELSEEETCRATIRMFVDFNLLSEFQIPYHVSISHRPIKKYKKYHGSSHVANN